MCRGGRLLVSGHGVYVGVQSATVKSSRGGQRKTHMLSRLSTSFACVAPRRSSEPIPPGPKKYLQGDWYVYTCAEQGESQYLRHGAPNTARKSPRSLRIRGPGQTFHGGAARGTRLGHASASSRMPRIPFSLLYRVQWLIATQACSLKNCRHFGKTL